jgi:transcription-repair coupling factor (superfamily II helicase)
LEKDMTLDLTRLLKLTNEMPAYHQLVEGLSQSENSSSLMVLEAAKPYLTAALYHSLRRPLFIITAQPEDAHNLHEQLSTWLSFARPRLFPEPDTLPYQRIASDASTELERLQVLSALASLNGDPGTPLVITSVLALMQKIVPRHDFITSYHSLKIGQEIEPLSLLKRWQAMGYQLESLVEIPGTISHRGGIVDIYPPSIELPARVEFYGNTVDAIRLFDPLTQRSQQAVTEIAITPATELATPLLSSSGELELTLRSLDLSNCNPKVSEELRQDLALLITGQRPKNLLFYAPLFSRDSVLSHLPQDTLVILNEPRSLKSAAEDLETKASELRSEKLGRGELPHNFPAPYFAWEELRVKMRARQRLTLSAWDTGPEEKPPRLSFTTAPSYAGQLPAFLKKVKKLLIQKHRLILISHQASRLSELLSDEDIIAPPLTQIRKEPAPGSLVLVQGSLAKGWIMSGNTHLLTDYEIFGFRKERRTVRKHPVPRQKLLTELVPGDYVVHIEHGIARFSGMTTLKANNRQREYLVLGYADDDKLYVPTDQIHRVSRYVGSSDRPPVLSRLGTQEWTRTKERTRDAAASIARELLTLYAAREIAPGFAFSGDTLWQHELEASFPYVETPDQIEVLGQVKTDMTKPKPMDRLVCGDVGYGKTEIAVRAAFKAVMDGKQVAILAPTTVLAQQHLATFSQRLSAFPIRIEALSRFKTPKEQSEILNGLARGRVDICIGTHRLLQSDVVFKDLGLLIIDEEQRFGVTHKESLKRKRREVDVLTLSATPIPRTLHMSLVGVRDMSTMETPPEDRLPIKTYVAQFDDGLAREAILRELERNGQVFFVHNRVETISMVADRLKALVPEANIAIAHGQMPEGELEKVMALFTQGKIDVLVCTTIIESGLDLPNVNTLLVNRADRFGLTQLYQLRGRVGRGANLAHAYFLYERGKRLTDTTEKRLKTIFEATELGSGFNIAIRDLEIRGAGTLLGTKQSGHISAVGFNLYCRLLAEAIEGEKTRLAGTAPQPPHLPPPTIDLPLPAYIPEDYVADLATRLSLYQRLADATSAEEIEALASELSDRFGRLPKEVENLLYSVRIKALATRAGLEAIATEHGQIILLPFAGMRFDKRRLEPLQREGLKTGLNQIRINHKKVADWRQVLEEILKEVGNLA